MSIAGIANWKRKKRSHSQLARIAAIVESSDDAIYGWGLDGTITSWNSGAVELFGYHAEEMVGRSFSVLMTPDQSAEAERRLESIRRGERVEPFQSERMRKDGKRVEVSVTVSAVRNSNGDVVGGATIARDITGWRQADEALRSSEERTRRIIATARDAFVGMDDAGVITDWNRSAEVAFGWSREEAIGRPLAETIIPVQHRQAHAEGLKRYQATGEGPVLDGRVEVSGLHRDGHVFPIELTIWKAGDSGDGQQFSAFIQDITDRKRDERERQNTLSLLSATLESTADGILVVDPDGRISSFNGKFAEMWRLPQSVLDSGDDRAAMAFVLDQLRDPDAFITKVMELYAQPGAESLDTLNFRDGRVFERSSKPQRVDGAVVGRVWSFHDLTDLKRMEVDLAEARDKALESSRLKSEFLATMSHEIRTPMNGVIGLTGLLIDTGLTDTQLQYADGVRRSGEALLAIINDILDFSKIEAGKLELELVDFDLIEALEEVVTLVAEPARAKSLELVFDCGPGLPTSVRGDVGRLRQILLNLVSNAIKFTETGEVVLRAGLGTARGDGQVVVHMEVVDTGIGIAPAVAERLFEPFSQGDASTTRRYGGTGLGLAICRQLAEAMGGSIGLRSDLGHGSTFWIDLPLGHITQPVRRPAAAGDLLHGLRVLVVDDNQTNRLVLASQLLTWDLAADLAPDAAVALEHLQYAAGAGRPYHVALLDLAMPDMDGLELARLIRAEPALADVRLLLLSSSSVLAETAAGAGFSACLTKPVRVSQLHDALVRTLAPPTAEPPASGGASPAPPVGSKGRLLVVEDNAINQAVAKGMVARLGYACDVAGNGIEALEALERQTYRAVLMDCQMPEMDGFEATAEIRRRQAAISHVPIIAMTAGALVEDRERCLAAGMDDYLPKPIRVSELERVLSRWLPDTAPAGT